jgi:AcrR family transcriptional regulator
MSPRPYRSSLRDAAAAGTRARILEAARQLLASEGGLRDFSVDAVAGQAGVARMTVYYQFKSKRGLLEAVFDDLAARGGLESLARAFTNPDPLLGLDEFVVTFCRFWDTHRPVIRRAGAAAVLDPELEVTLNARNERRRDGLRVLIGRLREDAGAAKLGDLDDEVDVLMALTSFATFDLLATTRRPRQVAALMSQVARAILLAGSATPRGPATG